MRRLLAERYPAVAVEPDPIFVRDGNVATSAGVTAGIDLALALVEDDLGSRDARSSRARARALRAPPGGQAQFSAQLAAQLADRAPICASSSAGARPPEADLSVEALAERAHMSRADFARAFDREVGVTPAAYVEGVRVERARRARGPTDAASRARSPRCGFGTAETMRRAFRRRLGVGPAEYRAASARVHAA